MGAYDDFVERAVFEIEPLRVDAREPGFEGAHSPALRWLLSGPQAPRREGLWCEFGVHTGGSLKQLAEARGSARIVGFDSFEGLPEDWRPDYPRGHFTEHGRIPHVDGAEIVAGLFSETLPRFDDRGAPLTLVHVDCDLYSSARTVLEWAEPRLRPGAVVVFDELVGYPEFREHEMRALYEAWQRGLAWDWLGVVNAAVAIRIK